MPEPLAGEVLVKITACGVCHTDLHVMKAEVAFPTPCVLGHETSGVVVALGPGVEGPAPGTAVASAFIMPCGRCRPCGAGRDDLVRKLLRHEPAARHAVRRHDAPAPDRRHGRSRCTRWPASRSMPSFRPPTSSQSRRTCRVPESAIFGCAVFTAYGAVRHARQPRGRRAHRRRRRRRRRPEHHSGRHAPSARRRSSPSTSATTSWRWRASSAPPTSSTPRAATSSQQVKALTDGRGVDVAFEALGRPETFVQAFEIIRDGGRMVAVGIAAGRTTAPVEITRLVRRGLRIIGSFGARTQVRHARDPPSGLARRVSPRSHGHQPLFARRGRRRLPGARAAARSSGAPSSFPDRRREPCCATAPC